MTEDELEDLLHSLNEKGLTPVVVGTDKEGTPFLAYGFSPDGDGWDTGVVTDDPQSLEFDYTDGTPRCDTCFSFGRRPLNALYFPVTLLAQAVA